LCTGDSTFVGPKKSQFSGLTPSNAPRNDVAPLKTITYRAIKTTGTLMVNYLVVRVLMMEEIQAFQKQFRHAPNSCYSTALHRRRLIKDRILSKELV
jgi:hypothetical protein